MRAPAATACPCGLQRDGRPQAWAQCCGRYMDGVSGIPAPDAQALMRSRYAAFVAGDEAWLLATWHPSTRPPSVDLDPATRWLGLEVREHKCIDADHAEVEFVARYRTGGGPAVRLHERSRFVREQGRWYYVDGDIR